MGGYKMKKFRGFICGFLAASVIFLCVPVVAETIQAVFNVMVINVDGIQVNEQGQNYTLHNGDEVPFSLVYRGTTYLPLRKLVEILGKDLTLDGETSTVYIKDKPTPTPTPTPAPTPTPTPKSSTIRHGVIDPSIPVPDQTNAIRHLDLKDPNVITELTLRAELPEGSRLKNEYDIANAIKYNGVLYYTISSLDRGYIIEGWNDTPLKTYGISYTTIYRKGMDPRVYIALYKGFSASEAGAILNQVYAQENDIVIYDHYAYIRFELVKEMLEEVGLNTTY